MPFWRSESPFVAELTGMAKIVLGPPIAAVNIQQDGVPSLRVGSRKSKN
jgi:hypothetical protein